MADNSKMIEFARKMVRKSEMHMKGAVNRRATQKEINDIKLKIDFYKTAERLLVEARK